MNTTQPFHKTTKTEGKKMESIDHELKVGFRNLFPEYALSLESAKSQEEIDAIQSSMILEAQENLEVALKNAGLKSDPADKTASIILKPEQYNKLIKATGNSIKEELMVMIDGLERLKNLQDDNAIFATAQLIVSGVLAIGAVAINATIMALAKGVAQTLAALAGVTTATVGVVVGIVTLVIVLIIIPIIYFMQKPALCLVLLINELDDQLILQSEYNVHGKPTLMTSPIPSAVIFPGLQSIVTAGLIASSKKESALVGTQYGFVMRYKDMNLVFGVESPLTSIYVDNNCYCSFGETAQQAAEKTSQFNKQYYEAQQGRIRLSIRCNSGSGSIAYYVARAYNVANAYL